MVVAQRVPYAYLDREFANVEPYLDDIRELVRQGDFTLGAAVGQYEERIARLLGVPYVIGTANGTVSIEMALRVLGVGPGDEVIVPANTFVATAGAVAMVGARPVFCDVSDDYTMDPESAARALTPRTRAVIPVHLTGTVADVPAIVQALRQAGSGTLAVVEDAAQALGATADGQGVGSWGDAAAISMHPLKMLNVWGDGGLVVTRSAQVAADLRLMRNHGLRSRDDAVSFGTNGRLATIQAVVANRVLDTLPAAISRRRTLAAWMTGALSALGGRVIPPGVRPGVDPVWMTYVVRVPEHRDALRDFLLSAGVEVKVHYPTPLHLQTVGRALGYREGGCPVAEQQAREILTLPLHEYLTDDEVGYMLDRIAEFFGA